MKLLTATDVADRWQVRPSHVYRLVREGRIPQGVFVQIGRYVRFRPDALERWEQRGDGDSE